jgi:hypothetical protein
MAVMLEETWTVGGVSITGGALKMLKLNADPPAARTNWLTAADSEAAALSRKPLHENRKITATLQVRPLATMDAAFDQVGRLVDQLSAASDSAAGVPVVWAPKGSARPVTFTALNGEIPGLQIGLDGLDYMWFRRQPVFTIQLDCLPYWEGVEVSAGSVTASTPLVTLEIPNVPGDVKARGRLVVTDTASQARRHVEWGLEGPSSYNPATSLMVDSDDMVTTGFSGVQAVTTGAYDPNAAGNNSITLTPIAGATTALAGTGNLSHVGVFRVKARVQAGSLGNLFRLSWKAGDGAMSHNDWVSPVSTTDWQELDLGTITIPAAVLGTQRWTGQVEVQGAASSPGTVALDYLVLVPQLGGYGKARAAWSLGAGVLVAQDAFLGTTTGAALATRTAPLGGAWATSGDPTDFVFDDNLDSTALDGIETIQRSTSTLEATGRFAVLGTTNYTDSQLDCRIRTANTNVSAIANFVLRYVDGSNHLQLALPTVAGSNTATLEQTVAGATTVLASGTWNRVGGTIYRTRLIAYASGRVIGQVLTDSGVVILQLDATSSAVATGGALATGKPALWDRCIGGGSARRYTQIAASNPAAEPIVVYSGRTMQVRTDDTYRDDASGTYTGIVRPYNGNRFTVPVGTSRVLVKARRNDLETATDPNVTDSTKIEVFYTPRGLVIPR